MAMPTGPIRCRREAFELFARQLTRLQTGDALLKAAVAISMHELEAADAIVCDRQIQHWTDQVRSRARSGDFRALLAHAHALMFDELGFRGNVDDYYNPHNSYVPVVLETRRGNPITLCLIYRELMRRAGLVVHGVNTPGHFLCAVADPDGGLMYVDPFEAGRTLQADEIYQMVEKMAGAPVPRTEDVMPLALPAQWLRRMLRNLESTFRRDSRPDDLAAMRDLAGWLEQLNQ
jgi:regulator of sirC expression with transglutaminase-like and TPR domain